MRRGALPLFRRSMADTWRSLAGYIAGFVAALVLYLPLYPSLGGSGSQMAQLLAQLPPQLVRAIGYDQISTGSGYTESTFYGLIGFALLVIAATSWSAAAIGGDEESGGLELTLAHAVSRQRLVLERTLAVAVRLAVLSLVSVVVVLALNDSAELGVNVARLLATAAAFFGLGLLSATLGIAVGALTGRRIYSSAAAAGIAVLGYVLNAIGNQSGDLQWMKDVSPYGWAFRNTPLSSGIDLGGLLLLFGFSLLFTVVGVLALRRRDIAG